MHCNIQFWNDQFARTIVEFVMDGGRIGVHDLKTERSEEIGDDTNQENIGSASFN